MERIGQRFRKLAACHIGTIAVTAAILWLTLAPHPMGDDPIVLFEGADKIVHALMFLGLADTFLFEEYVCHRVSVVRIWLAALVSALFGCLIELAQHLMGVGRAFEVADIISDISGAFLAALIALIARHMFLSKLR